ALQREGVGRAYGRGGGGARGGGRGADPALRHGARERQDRRAGPGVRRLPAGGRSGTAQDAACHGQRLRLRRQQRLLRAGGSGVTGEIAVTGLGVVARERQADDWFDVAAELGPRGYKYLPPASQYLLAAARKAVAGRGGLKDVPPHRRGAAVGTNSALRAYFDDADRKVTAGHSDDLSPAGAPYFAVKVLSGRLASEHRL